MRASLIVLLICLISFSRHKDEDSWIRINLLGYKPGGIKSAVWCSKENKEITRFQLIDSATKKIVFEGEAGKAFGSYGPFVQTYRLDFSAFRAPGKYYLKVADAESPNFTISENVYKGAADFCLRYMRQQRSGFNPFLKDSCHTHDGYTMYGPMPDSTHIDVVGGWHDATDYLQYATTSANATYHLLMAWRDFPQVFSDEKSANGLDGKNGLPDVGDEAKWGLDWLLKMHPRKEWMFNQIADDRDHISMRMPAQDSQYGRGFERPVYFINGKPQQRGQFLNRTTGTSSTAGKFASAFSLGSFLFKERNKKYSALLKEKSGTAYAFALQKPGVTQTVSVRSPYIYEEDNWTDDMELAAASRNLLGDALCYARQEPVTPWLGADTARHYQWYPFINLGHYELAKKLGGKQKDSIISFYREGIERVWNKAGQNAFYRGVPFIWCSNNLTTSFAIQCYWYRQLSGDHRFEQLEQACFDWIFGCNPWGTSMVYGLPSYGDTPTDPHSSFTHLKHYPIDGGLVDGPVYGSIFNSLKGITLYNGDSYALFQSNLAVYHDDYGDYSTNEPTMDGTASLIYLLAAKETELFSKKRVPERRLTIDQGAIVRGDSTKKELALVFTGDEFGEGGNFILHSLAKEKIRASFFLTGRFYRNSQFKSVISQLKSSGHYLGPHSNNHLLYCDWTKRDSLLVSKKEFRTDLQKNYSELSRFGISQKQALYFLPPYEWYNDSIAQWTNELGLKLVNLTHGTLSAADYTIPSDNNYRSSETIVQSIMNYESTHASGLNGFILLMHIGSGPNRKDKLYERLPELLHWLKSKGYQCKRIDELL
ncbi:MAG: glycoside hydrolase family 9 protein [Flavisolibacter sp.]